LRRNFNYFFANLKFRLYNLKNALFNNVVRKQNNNYKCIPIIIISYNQLCHLRNLIDYLRNSGYRNIVVIDNNSSYKPLLDYLNKLNKDIIVHRLNKNYGYRVFWNRIDIFSKYTKGFYAITDPDILPTKDCPEDFLKHFKKILKHNSQIDKVGFSLELNNIPNTNPLKDEILNWENKYWQKTDKKGNFLAEIDTTFALYRPGRPFVSYKGIRTKYPYSAHHKGWEIDANNLTEEQKYYLETANSSSSWNKK